MNSEEIIEMGKEAGLWQDLYLYGGLRKHLEAFAKLVVAKEREACAKVCIQRGLKYKNGAREYLCADAIRARGEA